MFANAMSNLKYFLALRMLGKKNRKNLLFVANAFPVSTEIQIVPEILKKNLKPLRKAVKDAQKIGWKYCRCGKVYCKNKKLEKNDEETINNVIDYLLQRYAKRTSKKSKETRYKKLKKERKWKRILHVNNSGVSTKPVV